MKLESWLRNIYQEFPDLRTISSFACDLIHKPEINRYSAVDVTIICLITNDGMGHSFILIFLADISKDVPIVRAFPRIAPTIITARRVLLRYIHTVRLPDICFSANVQPHLRSRRFTSHRKLVTILYATCVHGHVRISGARCTQWTRGQTIL